MVKNKKKTDTSSDIDTTRFTSDSNSDYKIKETIELWS